MTSQLWLSRITEKPQRDVGQILAALAPANADEGSLVAHRHRLLWHVFSDGPERTRDFLWTEDARGRFIALSRRRPPAETALFDVETKPFAPALRPGDRLSFRLSCNATRSSKPASGARMRGKREDVVMAALYHVPRGQRAAPRDAIAAREGIRWLRSQAERGGFALLERGDAAPDDPAALSAQVTRYRVLSIPRPEQATKQDANKKKEATFGVLDFEGVLSVSDPATFVEKLATGFGRGKAFGLGLMLIRRAAP